jgi:hypothetical protein
MAPQAPYSQLQISSLLVLVHTHTRCSDSEFGHWVTVNMGSQREVEGVVLATCATILVFNDFWDGQHIWAFALVSQQIRCPPQTLKSPLCFNDD